jgi:hypothetical protein
LRENLCVGNTQVYVLNKNDDVLTKLMSEEPINKKDDSQQAVGDAADNSEIILDETGDTVKPGPRGMANKKKDTQTESTSTQN